MSLTAAGPHERGPVRWAVAAFFALFCSCSILRPVRDEMGIAYGVERMQWLFSASLMAMVAAVPLFGRAASRLPRPVLVRRTGGCFLGQLVLFFVLFRARLAVEATVPAFFVWLSVYNLFVVSVFWSLMTDLFTAEQGRRLFGVIAGGGSAGGMLGPALAAGLAPRLGPLGLLPVSAAFLLASLVAIGRLLRRPPGSASLAYAVADGPLGGGALDAIPLTLASPRLAGTAALVVGYTLVSTILYFEQAAALARLHDPARRTAVLASIDLAVNATTFLLQAFATGRLLRRFGLAAALGGIPLLVAAGLLALAIRPALPLLLAVSVVHRAGSHALVRPGREVLFTALDPAYRYKAKSFVDTVLYRGGDAAGAWLTTLLRSTGLGPAGVAGAAVPLALAWMVTGFALGRAHERGQEKGASALTA